MGAKHSPQFCKFETFWFPEIPEPFSIVFWIFLSRIRIWSVLKGILNFRDKSIFLIFRLHCGATSDFPSQISRPTDKIQSSNLDRIFPQGFEKVEDYDTDQIELRKNIRSQWFWSILQPAIWARDFPHFGSNAESASHHLSSGSCLWAEKFGRENRKFHRNATEKLEKSICL